AEEPGLAPETMSMEPEVLQATAWSLVDPDRLDFGGEARGLSLAKRAVELAEEDHTGARASEVLAWAFFANHQYESALTEMETALSIAPSEIRARVSSSQARLGSKIRALRSS